MSKALKPEEAVRLALMLRPHDCDMPIGHEASAYAGLMSSHTTTGTYLASLEPTPADMHTVRMMLVCELTRAAGVREPIVYRLFNCHEKLYSSYRLRRLYDELPSVAVFADRQAPAPKGKGMTGAELSRTIGKALFG
jgi:hypothetical protein